ncbi:MAG: allantoicase [Woeseiaceae bacterium]|nr:allantoicase [Woeseiaceae bacterium]
MMTDTAQKGPIDRFRQWVRLEQPRLGSRVVAASDEFFGAKERLIDPREPVFIPEKYDDHGKWMDGWESRRRRTPGHDWCVLRLGIPGIVRGLDIDTRHFTGNYPPEASVDFCATDDVMPDEAAWLPLVERVSLQGNSHHPVEVDNEATVTHLRLNIFPDGGVARLRVYGEIRPDWRGERDDRIDLFAIENGGRALVCSDEHFGSMHNLNLSGRGINMGDGWETARRRGPGYDWIIGALGCRGVIEEVLIDTAHFKGNYPDRAELRAIATSETDPARLAADAENWPLLLPESRLSADSEHRFTDLATDAAVTHLRLAIFPDGGVSRLRLFGRRVTSGE